MNVETLIQAANPVPPGDLPDVDAPPARRTLDHILQAPAPRRATLLRTGSPASRLALVSVAAAGAAAVLVTVLLPASPAGHAPAGQAPAGQADPVAVPLGPANAASASFRHLALVADTQPASGPPGAGQFQYTKSRALNSVCDLDRPGYCVNYQEYRQIWIGSDGSGRIVQKDVHPSFPTPADRANWIAMGRASLREAPSDTKSGPGQLSDGPGGRNLWKLTTDPGKLAALISARKIEGGPPGPAEDFWQLGDILRETDAPPALRSAIFQVAAHDRGVRPVPHLTSYAGKPAVGVEYADRLPPGKGDYSGYGRMYQLIFDQQTSALLAERIILTNPTTRARVVTSFTDYLVSGVVDSTSSTTLTAGTGSPH
jgi:hypothetical protein